MTETIAVSVSVSRPFLLNKRKVRSPLLLGESTSETLLSKKMFSPTLFRKEYRAKVSAGKVRSPSVGNSSPRLEGSPSLWWALTR